MIHAMNLRKGDLDIEDRKEYLVTVVGCGRTSLSIACLLAEAGFKVICLDSDPYNVNQINKGISPFGDRNLKRLLRKNSNEKSLSATADYKETVRNSQIVIIAVKTDINKNNHSDYTELENCCRNVGLNLQKGSLVIIESTVGPATTETVVKETLETASGLKAGNDFGLVYSPSRPAKRKSIENFGINGRILSGINRQCTDAAKEVIGTITNGELIETTNFKTAETINLFENVYHDTNIALANEFAKFCEKAGIDYCQVQRDVNTNPACHLYRPKITCGTIPRDTYLFISEAENLGIKVRLSKLVRKTNEEMIKHVYNLIKDALHSCGKPVSRSKVAILGISCFANMKESGNPSVTEVARILKRRGARVTTYDPYFSFKESRDLGYPSERTLGRTLEGADCLLITIGHSRFKRLNLRKSIVLMKKKPALVDLANVVNPHQASSEGFVFRGLGRGG